MKDNKTKGSVPFFARFLEAQLTEDTEVTQGGQGTPAPQQSLTGAWKDGITSPSKDGYHTMKYPSDGDDTILQ